MAFGSWFKRHRDDAPLPEVTPDLAVGALLVRLAKSDQTYHVAEIGVMDRVLAARFNLSEVEAAKMRATCEKLEKAAPETDTFTALVYANIPAEQRRALIKALVDVARADGINRPEEEALIKELAAKLGVEER